ncbi:MAG: beta-ketoacyl synthase chain length factor [Rhodocyclaceae bacterium]|nr:beta-ketoacyl synthase chain length factor [Rhodocyclaceae bacterium]
MTARLRLTAWIDGVSVFAPGLTGWPAARAALAGAGFTATATEIPKLALLPPAERRRVGTIVRLALATGLAACESAAVDPAELPTVFASSGGDGSNCHAICETLASDDRLISPIRFHNSVNNAASGYWGIATGAMAPSAIVSAYDGSFAAGLLEAMVQLATPAETAGRILLVAYDVPYPQPLHAARPISDACGIGLVLHDRDCGRGGARITVECGDEPETRMADAALEAVRTGNPTARGLPLLAALAAGGQQRLVLPYHDRLGLSVALATG